MIQLPDIEFARTLTFASNPALPDSIFMIVGDDTVVVEVCKSEFLAEIAREYGLVTAPVLAVVA